MKNKSDNEQYLLILSAFEELIDRIGTDDVDIWHIIEVLAEIRAEYLFSIVADGMFMTYEVALQIVRDNINKRKDEVTDNKAIVLVSALENIIEFSVSQQYQMIREMPEIFSEDNFEDEVEPIFYKYNLLYATVEDNSVEQSAIVSFVLSMIQDNEMLQFTTQRDEKVRFEHSILDGISYRKSDFPSELIPPIDYNCRCFLVSTGNLLTDSDALKTQNEKVWRQYVNPIFNESLHNGGKIFSSNHPYFAIQVAHEESISDIIERITGKFIGEQ